jgi:hypothetical protein
MLKSIEDFVYEALTWIILRPRTLLRIVFQPMRMTGYADSQLRRDDEARAKDAISPPLLLVLRVLLAHLIDPGVHVSPGDDAGLLQHHLLGSEKNLLVYRTIAFGVWARAGAMYCLRKSGAAIDRDTMRALSTNKATWCRRSAFNARVGYAPALLAGGGDGGGERGGRAPAELGRERRASVTEENGSTSRNPQAQRGCANSHANTSRLRRGGAVA